MRRIVVLGCAGAGKTTFARRLARRLDASVICLDSLWRPEWRQHDVPTFRAIVEQAHRGEAWVSDGNFAQATFDLRLRRADLIVWLEQPRLLCAWRAARRVIRRGEAHRPADTLKVLRFIWRFDRVNRPLIETQRLAHGPGVPVVRLRSTAQVERFLMEAGRSDRPAPMAI
jgi:adenylate kinase family enzyme